MIGFKQLKTFEIMNGFTDAVRWSKPSRDKDLLLKENKNPPKT